MVSVNRQRQSRHEDAARPGATSAGVRSVTAMLWKLFALRAPAATRVLIPDYNRYAAG
jgi:hypothetical protein